MGKIIAIASNKGGVLKTSLTTNIAGVLAQDEERRKFILRLKERLEKIKIKTDKKQNGKHSKIEKGTEKVLNTIYDLKTKSEKIEPKKILIVDMDNQGNVGVSFGLNPDEFETTIYNVLVEDIDLKEAIVSVHDNIDIVIANDSMIYFEFDVLMNIDKYPNFFELLKDKLKSVIDEYDYIFIDSPPNLGLTVGNVLTASDSVLIPFQPETFSMRSLIKTIETVGSFRERQNKDLDILGIVGTLIDSRTVLHSEILSQCRVFGKENGIKVYDTIIPRSVRFANSVAYEQMPATLSYSYNKHDLVESYFELVEEMEL